MREAQCCGLEKKDSREACRTPGGTCSPGRGGGCWSKAPGTCCVGNAQWGGPQGQSGPERRMPVRQRKAGTTAGVPYDGLRQLWAETAVMPVRQRKAGTTAGVPYEGLRQQ